MKSAESDTLINWRFANWISFSVFAVAFILAWLSSLPTFDAFFSNDPIRISMWYIGGFVLRLVTSPYSKAVQKFEPKSPLEAKRANEQIKSLSSALNTIGGAVAVGITLKQLLDPEPKYTLIIAAVGLGVWIHTGARDLLGHLKDENIREVLNEPAVHSS